MFRGDGQSVEENQEDDQPIENLRFDRCPALPPAQSVPPSRVSTERERRRDGKVRKERQGERKRGMERWQEKEIKNKVD